MNQVVRVVLSLITALVVFNGCDNNKGSNTFIPILGDSDKVLSVILNKNSTTILAGGTEQLTATIIPANAKNQNIAWDSSDNSVVTVSNDGLVTAVDEGIADITVTTEDGDMGATCEVTVSAVPVPVSDITLNKDETTLVVGNSELLTADIDPDDATNQNISWISTNESITTVSTGGLVTAIAPGSASITAITQDGLYTDSCVVTVNDATIPDEVTFLTAATGDGQITLSWTDPTDTDFDHVEITWSPGGTAIQYVPKDVETYTVAGLYNGAGYTFTVKTVDVYENKSADEVVAGTPYNPGYKTTNVVDDINIRLAYVPAKSFKTGTDDNGAATVSNPYWIADAEVTYELWYKVHAWAITDAGGGLRSDGGPLYSFANPGREGHDGTISAPEGEPPTAAMYEPVTNINWRDAMIWCNAVTEWYNEHMGTDYGCVYKDGGIPIRNSTDGNAAQCDSVTPDDSADGFRLLSSGEWELAARYIADSNHDGDISDAGEYYPGLYASGAADNTGNIPATNIVAWWSPNSGSATHDVMGLSSNALGLYDMSGNVHEWCFDWTTPGAIRMIRGGSWNGSVDIRLGYVGIYAPSDENYNIGFRIGKNH